MSPFSNLHRLTIKTILSAVIVSGLADTALADVQQIRGTTMGTTYSVKWIGETGSGDIKTAIDERLVTINRLMSTYDPESELSQLNDSTSTNWIEVSRETAFVVKSALEMSELSGGAFDPTVGRLVRMWNFGKDPDLESIPPDQEIARALESVGAQHVEVRTDPPAIRKSIPEVELDLSAIAKGYAVDSVAELIKGQGLNDFMVEIGGEVITSGQNEGRPWRLGIQRPETVTGNITATIELRNQGLATSGDYRNYYEKDGVRYSHTIDPRTGKPVRHTLASATVVTESCMLADAWATTLMVLGSDAGIKLAEEHGITTLLLNRTGNDFQVLTTGPSADVFQIVEQPPIAAQENPVLTTFLIALSVFAVAMIGLASGVIFSNRTLKGSCGGADGLKDEQGRSICDMCTTPPEECDQFREQLRKSAAETVKSESSNG